MVDYLGWKGSPLAWSATASPKILVGKPPKSKARRSWRDMRADTNGGDHGTRSGTHVPRSCDHCLRMEDDGRDRMCAPNPAADEVAGRPSGSSPLGLYTLKFVLFGRGSQDNEDVERSRLFLNGKAAGGR